MLSLNTTLVTRVTNMVYMVYFEHFKFPSKSLRDAFHMAFAVYYELDFLLTWNCKNLANANIRLESARFNFTLGYKTPDI